MEREGKRGRGEKGKEGEESASPVPNSWIRPCQLRCRVVHFIMFY